MIRRIALLISTLVTSILYPFQVTTVACKLRKPRKEPKK